MQNCEFTNLPTLRVKLVQELHVIYFLKVGKSDILGTHILVFRSQILAYISATWDLSVFILVEKLSLLPFSFVIKNSWNCFEGSNQIDIF